MTLLAFYADGGSAEVFVDEAVTVEIVGGALSAGGPILARYERGAWHIGSQRLERITCKGRVRVDIAAKKGRKSFGPFPEFSLLGDRAVTPEAPFARYEALENTWYFDCRDDEHAPLPLGALVLIPSSPS